MDLIDWPGVARNALWILGLSIALAAWSHTRWWAIERKLKLRRVFDWPRFQVPFSAGLTLFCISLAWSATRGWERGLWILLGVAFTWQWVAGWRFAARHGWDTPPQSPTPPAGAVPDDPATGGTTPIL
jgi:hypothetical protein